MFIPEAGESQLDGIVSGHTDVHIDKDVAEIHFKDSGIGTE